MCGTEAEPVHLPVDRAPKTLEITCGEESTHIVVGRALKLLSGLVGQLANPATTPDELSAIGKLAFLDHSRVRLRKGRALAQGAPAAGRDLAISQVEPAATTQVHSQAPHKEA